MLFISRLLFAVYVPSCLYLSNYLGTFCMYWIRKYLSSDLAALPTSDCEAEAAVRVLSDLKLRPKQIQRDF